MTSVKCFSLITLAMHMKNKRKSHHVLILQAHEIFSYQIWESEREWEKFEIEKVAFIDESLNKNWKDKLYPM